MLGLVLPHHGRIVFWIHETTSGRAGSITPHHNRADVGRSCHSGGVQRSVCFQPFLQARDRAFPQGNSIPADRPTASADGPRHAKSTVAHGRFQTHGFTARRTWNAHCLRMAMEYRTSECLRGNQGRMNARVIQTTEQGNSGKYVCAGSDDNTEECRPMRP